jgi:GT2 family glycosyltransferase
VPEDHPTLDTPPRFAAIVVSYNTAALTLRCLAALERCTTAGNTQIVLFDNASGDGTVEAVRSTHPDVLVLDSPRNLGFAAGVDEAVLHTGAEILLLVNPDSEIDPGAPEQMAESLRRRPRSIVGGRILRSDGTIDRTTARRLPSLWTLWCSATGAGWVLRRFGLDPEVPRQVLGDREAPVPMLSGALLALPRVVWDELGGFDTRYFLYAEDVDLCQRAHLAGIERRLVPSATARHDSGASSSSTGKQIMLLCGMCTYLRARWSGPKYRSGLLLLRIGVLLRRLLSRGSGVDWSYVWARRAVWEPGYGPAGTGAERVLAAAKRK